MSTPQKRSAGYALVKAVTSGDSLVLIGATRGAPLQEKNVTLSGINTPRIQRGKKGDPDEPWAFHSRDFLRRKAIGQKVRFVVNYTAKQSHREYVNLRLVSNDQDLAQCVVRAGWAKVRPMADGKTIHPERQALLDMQNSAEAEGLGMWAKDVTASDMVRDIDFDPSQLNLLKKYKGKQIPAVVDRVRDGHIVRVELLPEDGSMNHTMIMLHLCGITCARTPIPFTVRKQQYDRDMVAWQEDKEGEKPVKPEPEEPSPLAKAAQFFTATRLLHRDVKVILHGTDKQGQSNKKNLFGTLVFAKGNVSFRLLEKGLAQSLEWGTYLLPPQERETMLAMERKAKDQKLGLWTNYNPASDKKPDLSAFTGKVVAVPGGDSIVVEKDGEEVRYQLASIRCNRVGFRGVSDEPLAMEAREFVRTRVIGKKMRIIPQYTRQFGDNTRTFVRVMINNRQELGEALVVRGLAKLVRHRIEEPRSRAFQELILAEDHAIKTKKGLHRNPPPPPPRVIDLTQRNRGPKEEDSKEEKTEEKGRGKKGKRKPQSTSRANSFLATLRSTQPTAIVEHVFSPTRLKVFVPKESCMVVLALAGIKAPMEKRGDMKGVFPEFAERSLRFVRSLCHQHDVRLEVEALDRNENFIGSVFIGRTNLAVKMLDQGLAYINQMSAIRSKHKVDLFAAEKAAKEAKIGIWKDYVPPKPREESSDREGVDEDGKELDDKERFINVRVTDIIDGATFCVQINGAPGLDTVTERMRAFGDLPAEPFTPDKNTLCAGQFSDGQWYRARLGGLTKEGTWRATFIDFGNQTTLSPEQMRELPEDLQTIPPLSHPAVLSCLKAPQLDDYHEQATREFGRLAFNRELLGEVDYKEHKTRRLHLTLMEEKTATSINRQLLKSGWVKVHPKPFNSLRKMAQKLKEDEESAKKNHEGVWEHGDISDDERDDTKGPMGRMRR